MSDLYIRFIPQLPEFHSLFSFFAIVANGMYVIGYPLLDVLLLSSGCSILFG